MRDIPVFTTENGAASLVLKEIPYSGTAYVTIRSTLSLEKMLEDCVGFCKAAGATQVLATGHCDLEKYPIYAEIKQMRCKQLDWKTDAVLVPVTADTLNTWQEIYNRKMVNVPTAAHMSVNEAQKLLDAGKAYYVCRGEICIGICAGRDNLVEVIASLVPGGGRDVLASLCSTLNANEIFLDVASDNQKAIRLYRDFGFEDTGESVCWHKIF